MCEMEDEAAAERGGLRKHGRVLARAAEPRGLDVNDQAFRAGVGNEIGMRFVGPPEQQR